MFELKREEGSNELIVKVSGRLDSANSPELEGLVSQSLEGVESLSFDFSELDYISSAGLRVLLYAQKVMNNQGKMVITGANDVVKEIFEVTGFSDILTVE